MLLSLPCFIKAIFTIYATPLDRCLRQRKQAKGCFGGDTCHLIGGNAIAGGQRVDDVGDEAALVALPT